MALLAIYGPPGKRPSLAPKILASIQRPADFGSYKALRQWIEQTHHGQVNYKTLYTLVRTRFKAKLKVPGPSHIKKA